MKTEPNLTKWPWRARFAHWVLGLIAPWLSLTPYEDPEEGWDDDIRAAENAAFEAGEQRGYEDARREAEREQRDREK